MLVPSGTSFGEFKRHVLLEAEGWVGWMDLESGKPSGDTPLVYPDGVMIQRLAQGEVFLPVHGEVKTGPTRSVVKKGMNLVATPDPGKRFLQDLGLENDLLRADVPWEADTVWIPHEAGMGLFTQYWIDKEGKWQNAGNSEPAEGKVPVGSAVMIERKGDTASFCLGD